MKCISIEVQKELLSQNPARFDYDKLAADMTRIFVNDPSDFICMTCGNSYSLSDKPYRGMWSMSLPKHVWVSIIPTLENRGVHIQQHRGINGNLINLYVSLM